MISPHSEKNIAHISPAIPTIGLEEIQGISNHIATSKRLLYDNFVSDQRPWVVAFSGGKDSTLLLQLVYEMLLKVGPQHQKPVHVITSDTRVEAPNIEQYLQKNLAQLTEHARQSNLDLEVHIVRPDVDQSFWGNLIGKGYPPPTRWFRWCTTKMKIKPVRKVVDSIVAEYGSVILLLGTRMAESKNRSRQMQSREYSSRGLNPHHDIPNALVLQPISQWTTEQVWEYLFAYNPPPWNGDHDEMLGLYRQANSGECPVVTDLDTPPCGGNRFGCWTCTVVKEDKSMKGFIDAGEEWMQPLYEFRRWLKIIREDEGLRNKYKRNGQPGLGPFTSDARLMILERLLKTEQEVGLRLIGDDELLYIQQVWTGEFDVMDSALRLAHQYHRMPNQSIAI